MTVRKNYRDVAYHNWSHGFHVANSTYAMLKSAPTTFRPLEVRISITEYRDLTGPNYKYKIWKNISLHFWTN